MTLPSAWMEVCAITMGSGRFEPASEQASHKTRRRDGTHCQIDENRISAFRYGHGAADGIRSEHPPLRPKRRHDGPTIDTAEGDEPGPGSGEGVLADTADVAGVDAGDHR